VAVNELRRGSPVRDVVEHVGLSHRRLIELFTAQVGMTPKLFGRVQRFQRAASLTRRQRSPDWANVAVECGYCDQSHLIRDFIAFSGLSPADFLRHSTPELKENHLTLLDGHRSNSSNTESEAASRLSVRKSHGPRPKRV
jgi:transcriptional regulator GlxA family with amidase domain